MTIVWQNFARYLAKKKVLPDIWQNAVYLAKFCQIGCSGYTYIYIYIHIYIYRYILHTIHYIVYTMCTIYNIYCMLYTAYYTIL